MAQAAAAGSGDSGEAGQVAEWDGVQGEVISDPEELRVIYSALDSFFQYARVAHFNCTHLRRQSFYALPQAHWSMLAAPPFNYLQTLDRVDEAIESNADLARSIATAGLFSFHLGLPDLPPAGSRAPDGAPSADPTGHSSGGSSGGLASAGGTPTSGFGGGAANAASLLGHWAGIAKHSDVDKARSTLRQFYRDWSAEGAAEREASYGPVKKVIEEERARLLRRMPEGQSLHVLVPGAGLGRLVFDLCDLGYEVEGNEISYHQLLASSYVLNQTDKARQHTVYPWIQTFSNHLSRDRQFRSYAVPDVHPATKLRNPTRPGGEMSMSAADFLCLYEKDEYRHRYDVVACVFFLDTAPNLMRYLEAIRNCLRPGGLLINIGPLLWHFENKGPANRGRDDDGAGEHEASNSSGIADPGSFELTNDEVMSLVQSTGFEMEPVGAAVGTGPQNLVETPYILDPESMLRTVYRSSMWVARKRVDDV